MKLYDLAINIKYEIINAGNPEIEDIIYDSRKAKRNTVFVCLKGYTSDGHKFAKSAAEKGVSALVISDDLKFDVPNNIAVIKVEIPDSLLRL